MDNSLLVPVRSMRRTGGRFAWGAAPVLVSPLADDRLPLEQLAQTLRADARLRPRLARDPQRDGALFLRRTNRVTHPQGYRLRLTPRRIELESSSAAGAYYGVQTLRELVRAHGPAMPCCEIADEPDFRRRGVYLDCSRGKVPTVEGLKRLVAFLASCKINELQLYIENVFTFPSHPLIGRGYDPFTPDEIVAVQDFCRLHHVRLVPSLTSFGHFEKILGLKPYRRLGELPGHRGMPGGTTLCPLDPGSIRLVADMYADFLPLFEADDFNACGDEPWELGQGRSAAAVKRRGLGPVYLDFVKKLHALCEKHGKRMNLWADIVLNHPEVIRDIPRDIVLLNWEYEPGGTRIPRTGELAAGGRPVMMCPGTHGWLSHGTRLEKSMANVARCAAAGRTNGAEGLLNTHWGDGGHRNPIGAACHAFAYGAAHAWHGRGVDDARFTETFCRQALGCSDAALAAAIRAAGDTEARIGWSLPYRALGCPIDPRTRFVARIPRISPVRPVPDPLQAHFSGVRPELCGAIVARLRNAPRWRRFARGDDALRAAVVEDLVLAAELDVLAVRRIMALNARRAGKRVPAADLRRLAADTAAAAAHLARNWRRDNKLSRLGDNLKVFDLARREALALAAGRES